MSDIKFTPAQNLAINHSGANLLVSAAAGSGKTAVVARRAVRLLTKEKVPVNKLLLITFTKAAAAEMRERVANVLKEEIKKTGDIFLKKQLRALPDADICTIDSYLTRLLRRHYHSVDIDPAFSIVSEDEKHNIAQKSLKKITDEEFEAQNKDFHFLCDTLGLHKAQNIGDLILNNYDYTRKYLGYKDFIKSWPNAFSANESEIKDSRWMKAAIRAAKFDLVSAQAALETAYKYATMPQGPASYADLLEREVSLTEKAAAACDIDELKTYVFEIVFDRLPRKDKDCDDDYTEKAKKLRGDAKKKIERIKSSLIFMPLSDIVQRHKKMLPAITALSRLVLKFDKLFTNAKRRYKLLDFADLMHLSLCALENEEVQSEERKRYDYVFVDEYQDTNRLQEKLIEHITKGNNLFCVGDVKQSIYSFRQAEPSLFVDRMDKSSVELEGENHLIPLSENFRSSTAVVDFINLVFRDVMTRETGGVDYTGYEVLKRHAKRPEGEYENAKAEVCVIDASNKDDASLLSNIEYEAILASDKIKDIMAHPIYDGKLGRFRPAKYSDICILSRAFKPIVRPVRRILEQRGIPVTPVGETGYLDMLEIEVAINILTIIDNHHRDVALISAMNSPAFGFDIAELINIRKASSKKRTPYHLAVEEYAKKQNDALASKVSSFLEKIEHYRLLSKHMPIGEFIWHMISDTMLYDAVGALPGGRVRQQNLSILAERGDSFSMKPGRNLSLFLEHLKSAAQAGADFEPALDESTSDSVKFMSVHKSKGLEFPVVILINTASGGANNTDSAILSAGLPPGVKCYDPDDMTKKSTLAYESAASSKKFIDNAESLRILYVALTRARERLIIIGSISRSFDMRVQSWTLPKKAELLFDKPFLDILCASVVRVHGNNITDEVIGENINNVHAEIIAASSLHHDKQKRKDAVLDAIKQATDAPFARDAFDIHYKIEKFVPAKTTATALLSGSPVQYEMDDFGDIPDFMRGDVPYDAAAKGTFTHTVMQFIDFEKDESEIESTIDDLITRNILPEDAKPEIDISTISRFLSSDICKRITASNEVKKELPFVIKVKASDVYRDISSPREILVQGIIDLCFKENDSWVIVDYKTNRIADINTPETLLIHYENQLLIYKKALQELTDANVKEVGVYFLSIKDDMAYYTI